MLLPSLVLGLVPRRGVALPPAPDAGTIRGMADWVDSVSVTGQRYAVPEQWRGRRVGLDGQAPPADLIAVPAEWSAEGRQPLLRRETLAAFLDMARQAALAGIELRVQSGFRGVAEQQQLFEIRLAQGREFSEIAWGIAPPGYSEHMLGTTVDLALGGDYADNPAYFWLAENAARFGFVETYPRESGGLFPWEPWHWRHVGPAAAAAHCSAAVAADSISAAREDSSDPAAEEGWP